MIKAINTPILILLVGLVGGICLQNYLEIQLFYLVILVTILLCFLALLKKIIGKYSYVNFSFTILLLLTSIFLGGLVMSFKNPKNLTNHFTHFAENGQPALLRVEILGKSYETEKNIAYIAKVQKLDSLSVSGKILLNFYPKDSVNSSFFIGDLLLINGKISVISSPMNPYDFDYKSYLNHHHIFGRVEVQANNYQLLPYQNSGIASLSEKFRNFIVSSLKRDGFSKNVLSVTQALLLGQRDDLSDTLYQNYIDSGGVHILAISGMHIGILTSILMFLLSFIPDFKGSKWLKIIIVTLLLWSYASLVGMSPSVMRSVTMFSLVSIGWYLNRKKGVYDAWLLAMLLLLLYNPDFLFLVGFQLSFSAVFFIITLVPIFQKIWNPNNKILRYVVVLFYVSLSAQMGVLPISLYYFHQFPALFFVTNLLIIPILAYIFSSGIITILLSTLSILPNFVKNIYTYGILYMNKITAYVATQRQFVIQHIYFEKSLLCTSFLVLIATIFHLKKRNIKRAYFLLGSIIIFQMLLIFTYFREGNQEAIWFLHSYRNSVVAKQNGHEIHFYTDTITVSVNRLVESFQENNQFKEVSFDSVPSVIFTRKKTILVVDNPILISEIPKQKVEVLYLKSSPKINLERYASIFKPKLIIADGSNYPSYILRWEKTAQKRKIRFHSIAKNGFLKITNN